MRVAKQFDGVRRGSQNYQILKTIHRVPGRTKFTSNRAAKLGITKLTARITELRNAGYPIETVQTRNGAAYRLFTF
jgi:hypothetical protein